MGKKKPPEEAPVYEGGPHEELFGFLTKEADYDAEIKPLKDLYYAKKKLLEQEALVDGRARKVASFYASFEGEPSRSRFEREED